MPRQLALIGPYQLQVRNRFRDSPIVLVRITHSYAVNHCATCGGIGSPGAPIGGIPGFMPS